MMKFHKIYLSLLLLVLMLPAYPMGAFFKNVPRLSTLITAFQWGLFAVPTVRTHLKRRITLQELDNLFSHDDFQKDENYYRTKYTLQSYLPKVKLRITQPEDIRTSFTLFSREMHYFKVPLGEDCSSCEFHSWVEGISIIDLPEFKQKRYHKIVLLHLASTLGVLGAAKGLSAGFKYFFPSRNRIPSLASTLLRIPATGALFAATYHMSTIFMAAYSRSLRRQADEAIPVHLAEKAARWLIEYGPAESTQASFFYNASTEPSPNERVEALLKRARVEK